MSEKPRKGLSRVLHVSLIGGIVFLAYKFIDFGSVWDLISGADPRFVAGILILATLDRFLMAYKWRELLRSSGVPASIPSVVSCYYQASVVSYLPFMVVGSDVLRGYLIVREHGKSASVLASMVVEKALGVISGCVLGVLGLAFVLTSLERNHAEILALGAAGSLLISLAAFAASLYEPFYRKSMVLVRRVVPGRLCDKLDRFYDAYLLFRQRKAVVAANLLLTLVEQFVQMLILLFAGLALRVDMPVSLFLAIVGLILLLRRFAIYFETWGIAETISVLLFGLVGLDASTALTVSLLGNGVSMIAILPGLFLMIRGGVRSNLAAIRKDDGQVSLGS